MHIAHDARRKVGEINRFLSADPMVPWAYSLTAYIYYIGFCLPAAPQIPQIFRLHNPVIFYSDVVLDRRTVLGHAAHATT